MAVRQVQLAQQVDGINLMRQKGGASPSSLFDLKNGWVTSQRTVKARPGSALTVNFPADTIGMQAMGQFFHTFSHLQIVSGIDTNVIVNTLRHPTGGVAALLKIHSAFPFLGRMYVVAEFTDNVVQHYWVENPASWTVNTGYFFGAQVQHPVANGYYYEIKTVAAFPAWQPNVVVALNDVKQPRVTNDFRYTVTAVTGTAPYYTSNTEPAWPLVDGATVVERRYITDIQVPPLDPTPDPPPDDGTAGPGGRKGGEYEPYPSSKYSLL